MADPAKSDVYTAIAERCTAEQIRDLLRVYKDINKETKKEVHVTGAKDDILANLKRAVSKQIIPRDAPILLLREAEENGHQHIFYFKPRNREVVAKCRDG